MKTLKFTTCFYNIQVDDVMLQLQISFYIKDLTNWKASGTYLIVRIKIYLEELVWIASFGNYLRPLI